MKLEDQVASLELCKRLKELGVKQNGHFSWTPSGLKRKNEGHGYNRDTIPDAFTVAELGEMLPGTDGITQCYSHRDGFIKKWVCYFSKHKWPGEDSEDADTEADARAKMLIYLIEKGIIKP